VAASVDLIIRVIADTKKASSDIGAAGSDVSGFAAGIKKAAVPAAIALAAVAAGAATAASAASRTEQAMGGIDSVFGKSAAQVKAWSDQAAQSAGLAKSEYGELATVIGSQLKNAGMPMQDVADRTNALIQKGADLSAMFGGTTADAVSALSSVLKGETDPIEAYGVSIKQADIAAQKAKDGTDKLTGAAGKQATAMAALKLVNQQTADSTGKFASESDTAAGSAQITAAKMENLKSQMGTALLPVLAALTSALGVVFGFMAEHATTFQIIAATVAILAAAILVLNVVLTVMAIAEAVALAPIILIVIALVALVAIVILVIKNFDTLKAAAFAVWAAIQTAFAAVVNWVKTAASQVAGFFTAAWDTIKSGAAAVAGFIVNAWGRIQGAFEAVLSWIKGNWPTILAILTGPVGIAVGLIVRNWDRIKEAFSTAVSGIESAWNGVIGGLKSAVSGLGAILSAPFSAVASAIQWAIDKVNSLIGALSRIHVPHISIPHIPGTSSVTATAARTAPGVAAPRVGTRGAGATTAGGGVTVNVTGAIDPEATARQIRRILAGHDRRMGLTA
jgi:hypothetical protein